MKFHVAEDNSNYFARRVSETGKWEMGLIHRTFGRVAVGFSPINACGPSMTYCCGNNMNLAREVMWIIKIVLQAYSEDLPEPTIVAIFPQWNARPIDQDDCITKLRHLALEHIKKTGVIPA